MNSTTQVRSHWLVIVAGLITLVLLLAIFGMLGWSSPAMAQSEPTPAKVQVDLSGGDSPDEQVPEDGTSGEAVSEGDASADTAPASGSSDDQVIIDEAANEVVVEAFVNRRINFPQITERVRRTMERHTVVAHPTLAQILEADAWARREAAGT